MLPEPNTPWPPRALARITPKLQEWNAWFSGDPNKLDAAYGGSYVTERPLARIRPTQFQGGAVGAVARFFWGTPSESSSDPQTRIHVPIAGDISQASADLLFADPPSVTGLDEAYLEQALSVLPEAAEVGAALGGTYLRAVKDPGFGPRSFIAPVDADAALPEFTWGRLSAATFWWVVRADEGGHVWRHIEKHLLFQGNGWIAHGLYKGTEDDLGAQVGLDQHTSTMALSSEPFNTGPGLAVVYVPNVGPQRGLRDDPLAAHLGRSDYDQTEPLMHSLDRVYSMWDHHILIATPRIVVPEFMLDDLGAGKGTRFDLNRSVYEAVKIPPNSAAGSMITPVEFAVDVDRYQRTAQQRVEDILRSAGYSAQTFGEDESGGAATATEVNSKDRRTVRTRNRKLRNFQPALRELFVKLAVMDGLPTDEIAVKFPPAGQDTALQLAQTALALRQAQAASTLALVQMIHPDWDETQVLEEAAQIMQETGQAVEDPGSFTGGDEPPVVEVEPGPVEAL